MADRRVFAPYSDATVPPSREVAEAMYPTPWRVEFHERANRARIMSGDDRQVMNGMNLLKAQIIVAAVNRDASQLAALQSAIAVADEARREWDAAPNGMRAGKILIALAGGCRGYRADIDKIHAAAGTAK